VISLVKKKKRQKSDPSSQIVIPQITIKGISLVQFEMISLVIDYGVAATSRLLKIIRLFCKRDL